MSPRALPVFMSLATRDRAEIAERMDRLDDVRSLPAVKRYLREFGLVDYWRETEGRFPSTRRGFDEICIERFPDGGGRQDVSIGGGTMPKWSADGRTRSYIKLTGGPVAVERVRVTGGASLDEPLAISEPTELFAWNYYATPLARSFFDMTADGRRFLLIARRAVGETVEPSRTILVQKWLEELEALVPVE